MGERFSSQFIRKKYNQVIELIKDLESNITKIPVDNRQSFRNSFIEFSHQYIRKQQHINAIDKSIAKNITSSNKFLQKNKDIFVTKGDKSNIAVLMNHSDYIVKMETLFNDINNYRLINDDPTLKLKKLTQKILNDWRQKGYLGKDVKKHEINNDNSNLARAYGLPKIHKEYYPLRIIVSAINSPTCILSKYLKTIITKSLPTPTSNVKNSWEFKQKIEKCNIPSNYVLLSLDVTSLFTNIPNELVMIGLKKRWELIKNNTNIPKKSFLNAVEFILNSTFFKFNNKFYNQVSGTPMGSSISPIIADLVMVDLETEILGSFDFLIPWYFRYVDDTILCVPQDKVDFVLCKFNSYNPTLQFTYEIESNNTLSFLDIKLIRVNNEHIMTNWYRKNTYSGRFLNFLSCDHDPLFWPNITKNKKKSLSLTILQPPSEIIVPLNNLLN